MTTVGSDEVEEEILQEWSPPSTSGRATSAMCRTWPSLWWWRSAWAGYGVKFEALLVPDDVHVVLHLEPCRPPRARPTAAPWRGPDGRLWSLTTRLRLPPNYERHNLPQRLGAVAVPVIRPMLSRYVVVPLASVVAVPVMRPMLSR